ncbi:protein translocase subunit secE/sec61 gamma [[Leptolyngbya] sp. PCC 7376]|uniref:preprotein translocase subunit SecE n=1 Tax=[Leptolyngbya] sp. PCC 7376 TaxID=111781 RepID=UPI00029EEAEE|nr:preprotein translocase subunit SecE [[Leptolyngbya] sp. PCC 7376]AFY40551.1 protein translocase subunit secE/sec61 gamma [[Leptolyngbya] sp. PCC 7376]
MAKTKKAVDAEEQKSDGLDVVQYANETKKELSKVVWPSRQQLFSESAAVILMVILVATIVYVVDNLFIWISGRVF